MLKLPISNGVLVASKRNVSEYAKKFGYKIKTPDKEVRVDFIKTMLYFVGAGLLIADMAYDKQLHYKAFIANYDENKRYYKDEIHFGLVATPDMRFLLEDGVDRTYKDPDHEPISKAPYYYQSEEYEKNRPRLSVTEIIENQIP